MIHPSSEVKTKAIGAGTTVWQFCVVLEGARIGKNCTLNCHVFIENDVIIGDNVTIKPGVQVWDGVSIEDDVFIGPNVTFTNDPRPRSKHYPPQFSKTKICRGATIGANATILPGLTIGIYSMIGAGSVVTKDVPPFTTWHGNPAVNKGYVTREGTIIGMDLKDKEGKGYMLNDFEPVML